jgi:hypothetical protein
MNDEALVAILAAVLSIGTDRAPEDCLPNAVCLAVAARKHVAENKRTQSLRTDYEIATATPEFIEQILKGEA